MSEVQAWLGANIDFPAIVLLLLFAMGVWVVHRTQINKSNNFDFADMLRDDGNKPSASRLIGLVCFFVASWGLMYILVKRVGQIDYAIFLGYCLIFSGTPVASKFIDAWAATKGVPPTPPTLNPVEEKKDGQS